MMKKWLPLLLLGFATTLHALQIPQQLWGTWTITRILPTHNVSCWGDKQAKSILGTRIEYSGDLFRWETHAVKNPKVMVKTYTAEEYFQEHSGSGGYTVSFDQLGIHAHTAEEVSIDHPDADITGATTEVPGDTVLIKSNNRIVITVCSVYFEAQKVLARRPDSFAIPAIRTPVKQDQPA